MKVDTGLIKKDSATLNYLVSNDLLSLFNTNAKLKSNW